MEVRWLARLGPPVAALVPPIAALGGLAILASSVVSADPGWHAIDACADGRRPAVAGPVATVRSLAAEPWYRLDPIVDGTGSISGARLEVGAARSRFRLDLPAESAAAGPFGQSILVLADDGDRSTISLVDAARGCAVGLAVEDDWIVRRATLDPAGRWIYEHRLERRTRASLGIWRRPLDRVEPAIRVLGPVPASAAFGRTFSTELAWSVEGDRLAVQSCGPLRCRTTILDPTTGRSVVVDAAGQGELVGVAGGRLVTYATCPSLPCAVTATETSGGRRTVVAATAGFARIVPTGDGPRLVHDVGGPGSGIIRSVRLDGSGAAVRSVEPGLMLVPAGFRAAAATRGPDGWVLLAGDARPGNGDGTRRVLLRLADGRQIDLEEVTR